MRKCALFVVVFIAFLVGCKPDLPTLKTSEIRIRDPFIVADKESRTYYMYAQFANRINYNAIEGNGIEVYQSKDLENWTGPTPVYTASNDFWAKGAFWAPEIHKYKGVYYLFVTLSGNITDSINNGRMPLRERATQIFYADKPTGPFKAFENKPHTPKNWMSLDGTLWVEDERPYMIFCHEWVQIEDGTLEVMELSHDLSKAVTTPQTLFKATDAPWVKSLKNTGGKWHGYITDGPFVYRTKTGKLLMIWSSFGEEKYAIGIAESISGKISGPWVQHPEPLFKTNGGHGMLFKTFNNDLMLSLHQPNTTNMERAHFFKLKDLGNTLKLIE